MPGPVELRLLAPAGAARDDEREPGVVEQREGLDERAQVLARLERRHRQEVRRRRGRRASPSAVNSAPMPGVRDEDAVARRTPSVAATSSAVKRRVGEDHVAGPRGVPVLAAVHRPRALRRPLGMVQRHEIVDRRRAHAAPLRRVHPVGEVQHVERRRASARPPGGRAPTTRCASRARTAATTSRSSTSMPRERLGDHAPARGRGRRERDDLVAVLGRRPRRARASEPRM